MTIPVLEQTHDLHPGIKAKNRLFSYAALQWRARQADSAPKDERADESCSPCCTMHPAIYVLVGDKAAATRRPTLWAGRAKLTTFRTRRNKRVDKSGSGHDLVGTV